MFVKDIGLVGGFSLLAIGAIKNVLGRNLYPIKLLHDSDVRQRKSLGRVAHRCRLGESSQFHRATISDRTVCKRGRIVHSVDKVSLPSMHYHSPRKCMIKHTRVWDAVAESRWG